MGMNLKFRSLGLALAAGTAIVALQPNTAMAQFWGGYGSWYGAPRPWGAAPTYQRDYDEDRLRPSEVAALLRERGWTILSPPTISGRRYVANVRNAYGQRLFVVVDAYEGRLLDARPIEDRPNTDELAAVPGSVPPGTPPDDQVRPVLPRSGLPTPAPMPRHPAVQAKRVAPSPAVKNTPLAPPKEKAGTVAVAKPAGQPPAVKPLVPAPVAPPAPAANATSSEPGMANSGPTPSVRQVYPESGAPAAEPPPAPAGASPQAAEASPPPAMVTSPKPEPPAPAKPAEKPALPPDAGFE
jgi:hypothetical protein